MLSEKQLSVPILKVKFPNGVRALSLDVDKCMKSGDTYEAVARARGVEGLATEIYERYLNEKETGKAGAYLRMKLNTLAAWTNDWTKPLTLDEWLGILGEIPYALDVKETVAFCNENGIPIGINSATINPYVHQIVRELKGEGLILDFAVGNSDVRTTHGGEVEDIVYTEPFDEEKWKKHQAISRQYNIPDDDHLLIDDGDTGVTVAREGKAVALTRKHEILNRYAIGTVDSFTDFNGVFFVFTRGLIGKRKAQES